MTPERWARVKAVVQDALDQPPAARAAWLAQACADDPALRAEAESLVAAADGGDSLPGARAAVEQMAAGAARRPAGRRAGRGAGDGSNGRTTDELVAGPTDDAGAEPPPAEAAALVARLNTALDGRYLVERAAGRGGMATVYLARDLKHRRPVALKVLHADLAAALGPRRFLREIETAAGLTHPHVLPLFDSGAADGLLYFVMPYVAGDTLRDCLRRRIAAGQGPLPAGEVARVVREVADALDYAHRRGVVHRDVKPENILLGEGGHALVADFGVALALEAADVTDDGSTGAARPAAAEALTGAGAVVGTPAYMSPEQAVAGAPVGPASDQYALACVAYELLAGGPAYSGPLDRVLARRHDGPPPSLAADRPELAPAADPVLARALARDPAARYPSASVFADALAEALVSRATPNDALAVVSPPSGAVVPQPTRSPQRVAVVAAAALALGVGAWAGWRAWGRGDASGPAVRTAAVVEPAALAVLPFENLGDSSDAYFADGVSDEVRGKLASLTGLRVIAGASSRQYRNTTKPPQQVARELGVRYLLVGRVRRDRGAGTPRPRSAAARAERVRVDPELVDVTGGPAPATRWQQGFDVPLADVFAVQRDIATQVTSQLRVALATGERATLEAAPTRSLDAYDLYLQGQAALARGALEDQRQAVALFDEVVRRDPDFALAWTGLVIAHIALFNVDNTNAAGHRDAARRAAERAVALAPTMPEVEAAVAGYTTYVRKDPARALADLAAARARVPYNAQLLRRTAIAERARGHLEAAVGFGEATLRLDPRGSSMFYWHGLTLLDLRRPAEARAAFDRTVELQPPAWYARVKRALADVAEGDLAAARRSLRVARPSIEAGPLAANLGRVGYDMVCLLDSASAAVLRARGTAAFDANERASATILLAKLWALAGDSARARAYADSAAAAFPAVMRDLAANPQVAAETRARAAVALAMAGRRDEALREAEAAAAAVPLGTGEHPIAYNIQIELARVLTLRGERARAVDVLAGLLRAPGVLTPGWLRVDPAWDGLRGDAGFARLAAGR